MARNQGDPVVLRGEFVGVLSRTVAVSPEPFMPMFSRYVAKWILLVLCHSQEFGLFFRQDLRNALKVKWSTRKSSCDKALERFAHALFTSIEGAGRDPAFSPREKVPRSGG